MTNQSVSIEQDKEQRRLALNATQSFIVQAPAGSGKTELLIQRFLTLLITVKTPEEILAITFTKKAANEMRARVIKALKQAQIEPEPESAHAKQTWHLARQVLLRDQELHWHLINNPNQLRIQTIDALCAYLTKQLPLLSHFGSTPNISDNATALYRAAVHEVLLHVEENYEWSQAISKLLLHLDNDLNKLHDLLVTLLAKRDQWLPYIHLNTNDTTIKQHLEQHLQLVISDFLEHLSTLFPKELSAEIINIARYAADNLIANNITSEITHWRDIISLPKNLPEDKKIWQGLATLLLTKDDEWRKSVDVRIGFPAASAFKNQQEKMQAADFKNRMTSLMKQLHEHDDLRSALSELKYLPEAHYQENQWEILQALLHVLKIVAAQLRVIFQQYGQIDFIQNSQAALEALGTQDNHTDLALALDYQIRHILVDEFQDTSLSQYQLLEKLITGWENGDGRTLFVVGDPMQSIYRFREAEVGLFIRMRSHGIGQIKLIPLTLAVNFRSAAAIVDWNNYHFEKIFPSYNDIATGAVTYSASVANQITTSADILIRGFANSDDAIQANHIISVIQQTLQKNPHEKIAILVRSRPHLKQIIPALKNADIPYRAVEIDSLASRQNIQDLLALTCAMLHPADRISWLAILRAPWCGLTLHDLLIIAGENSYTAIWERLENSSVINKLSTDGQQRIERILPILKSKLAERERFDLRSWIESTWLLLGAPACLSDETDLDDAHSFFGLLEQLQRNDEVINLDKLKEKMQALFAVAKHHDASVQIMTIHNAKGLEFDTVILPHLERKPASDANSLLLWMEQPLNNDQVALMLAPIHATGDDKDYLYDYVNRQHRIKMNYEIDRLFYVATTRAKKRLYLFFNATEKENGHIKIETGSFLQKIWPLIEKQKEQIITKQSNLVSEENITVPRYISRLNANWHNPIIETVSTKLAIHSKKEGFLLEDNRSRLIGISIHKLLQQIALSGCAWWTEKNRTEQEQHIVYHLQQIGVLPHHLIQSQKIIYQAITNTLQDERGQWLLQNHSDSQAEFALTASIDGEIKNLIIDRTFIDENGIRWIIDYKTTTFSHTDLEKFLIKEQSKYKEKLQTYASAMQLTENRPIQLGLYFPALPAWQEWKA